MANLCTTLSIVKKFRMLVAVLTSPIYLAEWREYC